jgi:hypothetical protein
VYYIVREKELAQCPSGRARLIKPTDTTNHLTHGLTSGVMMAKTELYTTTGCLLERDIVIRLTVVAHGRFSEV